MVDVFRNKNFILYFEEDFLLEDLEDAQLLEEDFLEVVQELVLEPEQPQEEPYSWQIA